MKNKIKSNLGEFKCADVMIGKGECGHFKAKVVFHFEKHHFESLSPHCYENEQEATNAADKFANAMIKALTGEIKTQDFNFDDNGKMLFRETLH